MAWCPAMSPVIPYTRKSLRESGRRRLATTWPSVPFPNRSVRQASCSSGRATVWPSVTAVISSTSAPSTKRSRSTECTPVPIIVDAPPISSGVSHHCVSGVRGMQGVRRGHKDAVDTRVLEEVAELAVRGACVVLLRERLGAVLIAAVDADELAAVGRGHRRRDLDVWMLARADDAPPERHRFSSVA